MSEKKKILIVEDEFSIAMDIEMLITKLGYEPVGICATFHEAVGLSAEHDPDVVLMDIRIEGDKSGVEAAQTIRKLFKIPVIFLTAHGDHATFEEARTANPYGYVLKPFKDVDLKNAIEIARERFVDYIEQQKQIEVYKKTLAEVENIATGDFLFIKEKGQMVRIHLSSIIRLEALDNYTLLFTDNGKNVLTGFLKDVVQKLPDSRFIRVHRSHAIALNRIDKIENNLVYIGKDAIPVSKSFRAELFEKLKVI